MSMSTTPNANKADHEILVMLQQGGPVPNIPAIMKHGETVHYKSDDGKVEIEFHKNGSPFLNLDGSEKKEVTSDEPPIELKKKGDFTCTCFITTPDGKKIGWDGAGGNHVVR